MGIPTLSRSKSDCIDLKYFLLHDLSICCPKNAWIAYEESSTKYSGWKNIHPKTHIVIRTFYESTEHRIWWQIIWSICTHVTPCEYRGSTTRQSSLMHHLVSSRLCCVASRLAHGYLFFKIKEMECQTHLMATTWCFMKTMQHNYYYMRATRTITDRKNLYIATLWLWLGND